MKFIYVFNKYIALDLEDSGLKKISEVTINDKTAYVFENRRDVKIEQYAKSELMLTNKLFFVPSKDQ